MDTEKDEDQRWIKFEEHMRKVIKEYREERRAKRREERIKIKESIRQQKKVWKLAQDRAWAAKIKDRRYRKKIRASRRNKVKWLKKTQLDSNADFLSDLLGSTDKNAQVQRSPSFQFGSSLDCIPRFHISFEKKEEEN
ncbi:unnamed protein product [Caenorhabditis nigoni]